jgi:hypothetical protein
VSDDVHNPFEKRKEEKRQSGVFDSDYKGDKDDPFKRGNDDERWDEQEDEKSTRDA